MNPPLPPPTAISPSLEIFYWQYKQHLAFEHLSIPSGEVLLEVQVQRDLYQWFFARTDIEGSERSGGRCVGSAGLTGLAGLGYRKKVLKEIVARMEGAVEDWEEQEVIDPLIEELAFLSSGPSSSSTPSTSSARSKSILLYTLPLPLSLPSSDNTATINDRLRNTISIVESPNLLSSAGTTGHRTWPASLHLATYLSTTPTGRALIASKSILELGAGTGLLSLICAGPLKAEYVLATDGDAELVRSIVEENLKVNEGVMVAKDSAGKLPLEARQLVWGPDADLKVLLKRNKPLFGQGEGVFDTILAADVTFDVDLVGDLAITLAGLLELCPKADILVSATVRNEETWSAFLAACLRNELVVEEVGFEAVDVGKQTGLFYAGGEMMKIVKIGRRGG